jgi:chloride channel 7
VSPQRPPVTIHPICRVGELHKLLVENPTIVCFPIVDPNKGDILYGTILRKTICTLFQHKAFTEKVSTDNASASALSWDLLQRDYPRFSEINDPECAITAPEAGLMMDLRPYINLGPHTIMQNSSLGRTYRMFRSLGLRHLCVVDFNNHVVGMITRKVCVLYV